MLLNHTRYNPPDSLQMVMYVVDMDEICHLANLLCKNAKAKINDFFKRLGNIKKNQLLNDCITTNIPFVWHIMKRDDQDDNP